MEPRTHIGIVLVTTGVIFVLAGLAVLTFGNLPLLGRLPGDITINGHGWSFHFPIVTGLILSIVLTLILNLIFRR